MNEKPQVTLDLLDEALRIADGNPEEVRQICLAVLQKIHHDGLPRLGDDTVEALLLVSEGLCTLLKAQSEGNLTVAATLQNAHDLLSPTESR